MKKFAIISDCGLYRYRLRRQWDEGPTMGWIMLNPSTADAETDDPTIRRCIRFARDNGYDAIDVRNLFALRATDPSELKRHIAPIGPENDAYLAAMMKSVDIIVCAWGTGGSLRYRDAKVLRIFAEHGKVPHILRLTASGAPGHPLYLPASLQPIPWTQKGPGA